MWVFDAFADLLEKLIPIKKKKEEKRKMTDIKIPTVQIPKEIPLPPPIPVPETEKTETAIVTPVTQTEPVTEPQKAAEQPETAQKQEITIDEVLVAIYNEVIELRKDLNAFIRLNMK